MFSIEYMKLYPNKNVKINNILIEKYKKKLLDILILKQITILEQLKVYIKLDMIVLG